MICCICDDEHAIFFFFTSIQFCLANNTERRRRRRKKVNRKTLNSANSSVSQSIEAQYSRGEINADDSEVLFFSSSFCFFFSFQTNSQFLASHTLFVAYNISHYINSNVRLLALEHIQFFNLFILHRNRTFRHLVAWRIELKTSICSPANNVSFAQFDGNFSGFV